MRLRGTSYTWVLVSTITIFYLVLLLSVAGNRGQLGWDEAGKSVGGVALIRYFTSGMPPGLFISILGANHFYVLQGAFFYGPLHAISSAMVFLLFGATAFAARIPSAVFGALGVMAVYLLANMMTKNRVCALLASVFLIGSPMYFDFSTMNFSEIPILFSITIATYLLFKTSTQKDARKLLLLGFASGMIYSLAALTKPSAMVMVLPLGAYTLYRTSPIIRIGAQAIGRFAITLPAGMFRDDAQRPCQVGRLVVLASPLLVFAAIVIMYWAAIEIMGALPYYLAFCIGGHGFHPETEPFSSSVFANSWKPFFVMLPIPILLLAAAGTYYAVRNKRSPETGFLLLWIAAYWISLIASGAVAPNYPLPALPAIVILAAIGTKWITDEAIRGLRAPNGSAWKISILTIIMPLVILQAGMVPIYKSISLKNGNEIGGEAYNPLILRTLLQKEVPSLYWIDTRYFKGTTINFYARNHIGERDTISIVERRIVQDIHDNGYRNATIMLYMKSNYLDFLLTADDKNLTYKLIRVTPDTLPQTALADPNPKYLVATKQSETGEKTFIYKLVVKDNNVFLKELWSG